MLKRSACTLLLIAALLISQEPCAQADKTSASISASDSITDPAGARSLPIGSPIETLKHFIAELAAGHPDMFDPKDVDDFLHERGPVSAQKFLTQRSQNWRRAARLAQSALKWRKSFDLNRLEPGQFPCDLFKMGLIFEEGRAHKRVSGGEFEQTSPVIWLRLGALGAIIKQLERVTPARAMSTAYNSPREMVHKLGDAIRNVRQRRHGRVSRSERKRARREHNALVKSMSAKNEATLRHVLKAVAWWIDDWVQRNGDEARATLVLDFEDTDFAFASWSMGEFFVRLDDMFPDLFEQILGFRYKAKLWSLHSPISMFNRIFKSRISSSPETDAKLKFVSTEPQISVYMPRVDSQGFTMLPEYVSGTCVGPDESKAPTGCQTDNSQSQGLYDPGFWQAIFNEFYYSCKAKPRS